MKIKDITVGIKSLEQGLKEFGQTLRTMKHGHSTKERRNEVYFIDVNALHGVLTPKRLDLIRCIREQKPDSVYELARKTGRNLKNVREDVVMLERIGLITVSRGKEPRKRSIPHVDYDRLRVSIPVA